MFLSIVRKKGISEGLVSAHLAKPSPETEKAIRVQLNEWSSMIWNDHGNTSLKEIGTHAAGLSALSSVALEAMDLRNNGTITSEWIKTKQELIKKYSVAIAETELDVIPELTALITGKLSPESTEYPLF